MKKTFLILLLTVITAQLLAQRDSSDNYVKQFMKIPTIRVNAVPDSAVFTNANIKKQRPFILMFFNPDCDHCQKEIKELMAYKQELQGVQILMVSSASHTDIKDFYNDYKLSSMFNVSLGQDAGLKLTSLYRVRTYPSMFVYDVNGNLAKAFVGNIGIPAILDAIK